MKRNERIRKEKLINLKYRAKRTNGAIKIQRFIKRRLLARKQRAQVKNKVNLYTSKYFSVSPKP